MFGKGIKSPEKQWTMLCGNGSPSHSSLTIGCQDFVERKALKNFWWYSGTFLSLLQTLASWPIEVSSDSNCHRWFVNGVCEGIEQLLLTHVKWTADILTAQIRFAPKNYFKTSAHCPLPIYFPLLLVGGGLERRLMLFSTLIKVGFGKHKPIERPVTWSLKDFLDNSTFTQTFST